MVSLPEPLSIDQEKAATIFNTLRPHFPTDFVHENPDQRIFWRELLETESSTEAELDLLVSVVEIRESVGIFALPRDEQNLSFDLSVQDLSFDLPNEAFAFVAKNASISCSRLSPCGVEAIWSEDDDCDSDCSSKILSLCFDNEDSVDTTVKIKSKVCHASDSQWHLLTRTKKLKTKFKHVEHPRNKNAPGSWLKALYRVIYNLQSGVHEYLPWSTCGKMFAVSQTNLDRLPAGHFKSTSLGTFNRRLAEHGFKRHSEGPSRTFWYTISNLEKKLTWEQFASITERRPKRVEKENIGLENVSIEDHADLLGRCVKTSKALKRKATGSSHDFDELFFERELKGINLVDDVEICNTTAKTLRKKNKKTSPNLDDSFKWDLGTSKFEAESDIFKTPKKARSRDDLDGLNKEHRVPEGVPWSNDFRAETSPWTIPEQELSMVKSSMF
jgi:hypothetical protein